MITCVTTLRMIRSLFSTVVVAALVLATFSGCGTTHGNGTSGPKSIVVEISTRGSILVSGTPVRESKLVKALKRQGATSRTAIRVVIPLNPPRGAVKRITEKLVAGGLPRVIFSTPRKATAASVERR
ncbi:MAG: biopolymer transport protein ExbD [Candidatus Promineifilaceae bacterium]|jgi:biopolymer transport protein ExbD